MTKPRGTVLCLLMLLLSGCGIRIDVYRPDPCAKEAYFTVGPETVWRLSGDSAFFYEAGMTVTADGAPNAYHPTDDDIALDFIANAGVPGDWWAIVTDEDGEPHIQGPDDRKPG